MKKLIYNTLCATVILVLSACNKDQGRPFETKEGISANELLIKEMKGSSQVKRNYSISDIPLKITYRPEAGGTAADQAKKARLSLKKQGFAPLTAEKRVQSTARVSTVRKFDQLVDAGKVDPASFELQTTLILRDMGLLEDTSKAARERVRRYLDGLLDIRSNNIALEYFALRSIEQDLNEPEMKQYASKILQVSSNSKDYENAKNLKNKMKARLESDPDIMTKKGALTALQLWKLFNHVIAEHEFYQHTLRDLADPNS